MAADGRTVQTPYAVMQGASGSAHPAAAASNLFATLNTNVSNTAEGGTTSGFAGEYGGVVSLASDYAFSGARCILLAWPANNGPARLSIPAPTLVAGHTYQLTYWFISKQNNRLRTSLQMAGTGAFPFLLAQAIGGTDIWSRASFSFTPATTNTATLYIEGDGGTTAGSFYIDAMMLTDVTVNTDAQAYPPPWVPTSLNATTGIVYSGLKGVLGSAQGCTLNLWCSALPVLAGSRVIARVADSATAMTNGVTLTCSATGPYALSFALTIGGVTTPLGAPAIIGYSAATVYMLTLVVRASPRGNQPCVSIYVNGNLVQTSALVGLTPATWAALVLAQGAGNISECDVLPFVLSIKDIAWIYANRFRMGLLPQLNVQGTGFAEPINALGMINNDTFTLAYDEATSATVSNGRMLDISLQEV